MLFFSKKKAPAASRTPPSKVLSNNTRTRTRQEQEEEEDKEEQRRKHSSLSYSKLKNLKYLSEKK